MIAGIYAPAVLRCGYLHSNIAKEESFRGRRSYRLFAVLDGAVDLMDPSGDMRFGPDELLLLPPDGDSRMRYARGSTMIHAVFDVVPAPRQRSRQGDWQHQGRPPPQPRPRAVWGVDLPHRVPAHLGPSGRNRLHLVRATYWRSATGYARASGHLAAWLGDLVEGVGGDRLLRDAPEVPPALTAAMEAIDDPQMAPLSVAAAAQRAGVSREHLARLARRHLGSSLHDCAEHRRRDMAARLLMETDHPIAVIGTSLGYRQAPSFHRAFRRWFGMTPAAFRGKAI